MYKAFYDLILIFDVALIASRTFLFIYVIYALIVFCNLVKKTIKLILGLPIVLFSCSEAKQSLPVLENEFVPTRLAELTDKRLEEVSGIAASANNPGLLWAHNDSGNSAEIL